MRVNTNEFGVVIEVEHQEVDTLVTAISSGAGGVASLLTPIFVAAGVSGPIGVVIIAAVGAYAGAEIGIMKACDKGNGVYLTMLYAAPGIVIPTTRPSLTPLPPPRWCDRDSGTFGTQDRADSIAYTIQHAAIGPEEVKFRLVVGEESSGWKKIIHMPDGQGSSWDIVAEGNGGWAENGLWASQVKNGQALTFRKAKTFGRMRSVLEIRDLDGLRGGDLVEFRWNRD